MPLNNGDFILLNYTLKVVENGKERVIETTVEDVAKKNDIFDPNVRYQPMPVIIGMGRLVEPIEEALKTMDVGEKKEVEIPPEKAYGDYKKELVIRIPVKTLRRRGIPPRVGEIVRLQDGREGRIIRVTERFAYVDFNHPLAGKTLKADLEVVKKIEEPEEKAKYLAIWRVRVSESSVKAEVEDSTYKVVFTPEILVKRDLDTLLAHLINDIHDMLGAKRVQIVIDVEFPEEAETGAKAEEAQEATEGEAGKEAPREEAGETGGKVEATSGEEAKAGASET